MAACATGKYRHLSVPRRTNIFFLKLSGKVALDEGGFADTAVAHENELR